METLISSRHPGSGTCSMRYPHSWADLLKIGSHTSCSFVGHPRVASDSAADWNRDVYQAEAHIAISSGTGYQLLGSALASQHIIRRVLLELPGFLGPSAILSTTDLIATLPRHIGETLARATGSNGLRVLPCPVPIPGFTVKQYWHARYHHDAANRWIRSMCATLFMQSDVIPIEKREPPLSG